MTHADARARGSGTCPDGPAGAPSASPSMLASLRLLRDLRALAGTTTIAAVVLVGCRAGSAEAPLHGIGVSDEVAPAPASGPENDAAAPPSAPAHVFPGDASVPEYVVLASQGRVGPPAVEDVENACALLASCPNLPWPPEELPRSVPACARSMTSELASPGAVKFSLLIRECALHARSCDEVRTCALRGASPDACSRPRSRRADWLVRRERARGQLLPRQGRRRPRLSARRRRVRAGRRPSNVRARSEDAMRRGGRGERGEHGEGDPEAGACHVVLGERQPRRSVRPRESAQRGLLRVRARVLDGRREGGMRDDDPRVLGQVQRTATATSRSAACTDTRCGWTAAREGSRAKRLPGRSRSARASRRRAVTAGARRPKLPGATGRRSSTASPARNGATRARGSGSSGA